MRIQGCITQKYFLFVSQYDFFPRGPKEPIEERAGMDLSWAHLSGLNRAESTRVKTAARCGCSCTLFHSAIWLVKLKQSQQKQSMDYPFIN